MKIVFWSNARNCGVTSNLAAISIASVMRFPWKIITLENHHSLNNLGCAFLGMPRTNILCEAGANYYEGGGSEGFIRNIYRGNYNQSLLEQYIQEVIHNHLYYLPQGQVIPSELFDYEFNHSIDLIFQLINHFAEISFIDTACCNSLSSKTILEEADLIVINLCQDPKVLEDFFLNYNSLLSKAIILVSKYSSRSIFSIRKIAKMYRLSPEELLPIPYNESFWSAYNCGSLVEFMISNYLCKQDNPNYFFIQAVKKAAYQIMKKVELRKVAQSEKLG
ncbi:MAG: hypothetical protein GX306_13600 [Clostridiales bacterium]|nr:hypothetical protein [Clostridiales bacterium]